MNIVVFTGKLTRDPKITQLLDGSKVCEFTLTVKEPRKSKKDGKSIYDYSFPKCRAWDTGAEIIASKKKGDSLMVKGKFRTDSWVNSTGEKRSRDYIRVDNFESIQYSAIKIEENPLLTSSEETEVVRQE